MMIRDIQQVVLKGLLICCLGGCTVTNDHKEGGNPIPESWSTAAATASGACVPVDGVYQTFGVGKFERGEDLTQVRLDAAMGYVFPTERIPENVGLSLDQQGRLLRIQFSQPVNKSFTISVICSNGWYKIEQSSTNQYIGDGTTLDYSISKIELKKLDDGDLMLHSLFEVQSSSFLIHKSRDTGESWSKYEEVKHKN